MSTGISPLSDVSPDATLGKNVKVGPFCVVGPGVNIGDDCVLHSHVVLSGRTSLGRGNHLHPGCVIGGPPQDVSYRESDTEVLIGDGNTFREGVTVNRGAEKEDGVTRIGDRNLLMANSHVAHNCHIHNDVILVNGVLLGGHVHVHDRAIVSGNSVVHHFSTIGRLAFVSGGCRVPHDIPPFMLAAGSDNPTLKTINLIGLQRAGISRHAIDVIKHAYRMLYRRLKPPAEVRDHFLNELDGPLPIELSELLQFVESQRAGHMGRAREAVRRQKPDTEERKAA